MKKIEPPPVTTGAGYISRLVSPTHHSPTRAEKFRLFVTLFEKLQNPKVKMAYHPKTLQCLGITQIVTGAIAFFLGIGSAVVRSDFTSIAGFGIWVGLWVSL